MLDFFQRLFCAIFFALFLPTFFFNLAVNMVKPLQQCLEGYGGEHGE